MFRKQFFVISILALCSALTPLVLATELPRGVSVSIQPLKAQYRSSDELAIKLVYRNETDASITFLAWDTALEGLVGHDFLQISLDGKAVPYIGKHAKRLPPTKQDYVTIAPRQTVDAVVDLNGAYAINRKGEYTVAHRGVNRFNASAKRAPAAKFVLLDDKPIKLLKRTPIINASCDATQRAQIDQALTIAERIAVNASRDLNSADVSLRPNARRYVEWFGAYSADRYAAVSRGMANIAGALVNNRIGFDCTCDDPRRDNLFAFVFPNDPFNMNVCPVFFRVSAAGTDSRSGTIVHEISHFNAVASTDDFSTALNQSGSRALARSNPTSAIRNANAFEYFAENTPFLSMPFLDVSVRSATVSSETPRSGSSVSIAGIVSNLGNVTAPASAVSVKLSEDAVISLTDSSLSQASTPAISAGANFSFKAVFNAPREQGEYFVGVCVSAPLGEVASGNNCSAAFKLTVGESVTISPILLILLDD